jgi:hypothetical protein
MEVVISELDDSASALGVTVMQARELLGKLGLAKPQTSQTGI